MNKIISCNHLISCNRPIVAKQDDETVLVDFWMWEASDRVVGYGLKDGIMKRLSPDDGWRFSDVAG